MRVGLFVAATGNYLSYTNALINSIAKRRLYADVELTVYLLHCDFPTDYLMACEAALPFEVVPIEIRREEVPHPKGMKRIEFVKRARYFYVRKFAAQYDVTILMDADMFFVSERFMDLARLVDGTGILIGCNETFKWDIGNNYTLDGKPIFNTPTKLQMFHCNVPAIFDMKCWQSTFEYYARVAFDGQQEKHGQIVGIGDIFAWNIAVYKTDHQNDVVLFPMDTMTQVHQTARKPSTYLINENGYWRTAAGDPVYSIHGRIAQTRGGMYVAGNMEKFRQEQTPEIVKSHGAKVERGLKAAVAEWYDLNFRQRLVLSQFVDVDPVWESFKGDD